MKIGSLDIAIRRSARKKTITVNVERDDSVNAVVPSPENCRAGSYFRPVFFCASFFFRRNRSFSVLKSLVIAMPMP